MKRNLKSFFRSFYLSAVIVFCLIFAYLASVRAYESIRRVGFGDYRKAVEISAEGIKLFDFEIKWKNFK